MTDAQITTALKGLNQEAKRALAAKLLTTERNIYRWQRKPPTQNALVRAALEAALQKKR